MRAAVVISTVVWATASAQSLLPPERGAEYFSRTGFGLLKCEVQPLRPVLDFSFRFHAGYTFHVPLNQYRGPGHRWTAVVRVQPELVGSAVYFIERLTLPDVPAATKVDGSTGGGFMVGEGYYHASFLLMDDQGRACHSDWPIEAQLGSGDGRVKMAIEPGAVQSVALRRTRSPNAQAEAPFGRLTVLLHAAPVSTRMSTVQASDAVTLLGSLSSLLDLAPAESVRLVVFNLDQQKEIYREDHFTLDRLGAVRQAIFNLQLAVVDFHTLQNPTGHMELLGNLVKQELRDEKPADAVVFLGPHARLTDKPAPDSIEKPVAALPKFFYVEYQRPVLVALMEAALGGPTRRGLNNPVPDASVPTGSRGGGGGGVIPGNSLPPIVTNDSYTELVQSRDTIDYLVAMLKGKTLVVRSPGEFAKAIQHITTQRK